MFIKFLVDLSFEGNNKITAGSVVYCRRTAVIEKRADGTWGQRCSTQTIEVNGLIMVLPDNAEGELYYQVEKPVNTREDKFYRE